MSKLTPGLSLRSLLDYWVTPWAEMPVSRIGFSEGGAEKSHGEGHPGKILLFFLGGCLVPNAHSRISVCLVFGGTWRIFPRVFGRGSGKVGDLSSELLVCDCLYRTSIVDC